jgi:RNA polymerase sigma-70 factor, ECF subfamily
MPQKSLNEFEFNELFNLHYEELCRIVFPIIKDKEIAEDVVQDVFVKLWIRRNELTIQTTFKAYMYKAVIFRSYDYLRKQKNTTKVNEDLKLNTFSIQNNIDAIINEKELKTAIMSGLDKMSENMRMIFQLSRFSELKNREIAEELNISIKTVESNMAKALKLMHEHLKPFLNNRTGSLIFYIVCEYFK